MGDLKHQYIVDRHNDTGQALDILAVLSLVVVILGVIGYLLKS